MKSKISERVKYIGKDIGYITIIDVINVKGRNHFLYRCCCGKEKSGQCTDIIYGRIRSCGCMTNKMIDDSGRLKHGMTKDRFYHIYHDAKKRCENNMTKSYKDYGGRGIKMERKTFEDFKLDMYDSYLEHSKKYGEKNTTIERINVNGNYCKNNCKWITMSEQADNKQCTIYIGGKLLKEIAKDLGLSYSCIYHRYITGQDVCAPRKINQHL